MKLMSWRTISTDPYFHRAYYWVSINSFSLLHFTKLKRQSSFPHNVHLMSMQCEPKCIVQTQKRYECGQTTSQSRQCNGRVPVSFHVHRNSSFVFRNLWYNHIECVSGLIHYLVATRCEYNSCHFGKCTRPITGFDQSLALTLLVSFPNCGVFHPQTSTLSTFLRRAKFRSICVLFENAFLLFLYALGLQPTDLKTIIKRGLHTISFFLLLQHKVI